MRGCWKYISPGARLSAICLYFVGFAGFAVLSRSHAGLFLKESDESRGVRIANFSNDFLYIGIGFPQKLHCLFHFDVGHIVGDSNSGILPENLPHTGLRNGEMLGNGADLEIIRETMLLNIFNKLRAKIRLGRNSIWND